jgi:hypothetical protein
MQQRALCWRKNESQEKSGGFLCHVIKNRNITHPAFYMSLAKGFLFC